MAFQVIQLPSYTQPNSGYSTLGDVLLGASSDYLKHTRDIQHEDKLRAQHLADVQSERTNEAAVHARNHGETLADTRLANEVGMRAELIRLGFLSSDKLYAEANDPAVLAAAQEFGKTALAKTYIEAVNSGFLSYSDFGDKNKVDAGLAQWSKHQQQQTALGLTNQANATAQGVDTETQLAANQQKIHELEQKIDAEAPPITKNDLMSRAAQNWASEPGNAGKAIPTDPNKLSQELAQAQTELAHEQLQKALLQNQELRQQWTVLHGERQSLMENRRVLATSAHTFGAPVAAPSPVTQTLNPNVPKPDPDAALKALQAQAEARRRAQAAEDARRNPTSSDDPYAGLRASVAAGKARTASAQNLQIRDPYTDLLDQLQQVRQKLVATKEGLNIDATTPQLGLLSPDMPAGMPMQQQSPTLTPEEQNSRIQELQAQESAILQKLPSARGTMLNLSPDSSPLLNVDQFGTPHPVANPPSTFLGGPSPGAQPNPIPTGSPDWWRFSSPIDY